ncbi:membrane protein involved in the export of O-antigen and teichoic acid [Rivularia sp. PCC 7116]|uniref:lipopolysaccharide biosynthesis protein n=1 Tax=Rivularia sp. PCC 7116 TaxID=373994 RepID=UPI00029ECF4B|nr:lipopolysaccharide biosynthesis protein [Rivularia sp. PCC 7116]AFY58139.1 membrane protein involved in the export of O-antigen and teichoic acid [Rivularia sp. PCC 7116]
MIIEKIKQQLSNQFIRNIGWLGGAELVNRVFRLGATVILARALTPQDYGLAAIVLTINEFTTVFTLRAGIGGKIVQADEEDVEVFCNTAYWLNWILCISLFVIQCIAAFPIAWWYNEEKLILPLCVYSLVYLMLPFFAVHNALIDRANRLKITAISTAIQSMLNNILIPVFALSGMGMWALVLPGLFTTPVWIVVTHLNEPWRPKMHLTFKKWKEIVNFGKDVLGYELLEKLRANIDYLIVGRLLGVEALGIYFFAFNAGLGISLNVINIMVWPLYPHLCAARQNFAEFKQKYFHSLKTISLVIVPLVLLQSSLAPFYVPIVFGEKWKMAVPILVLICLSAIPRPFGTAAALLLQSLDKAWINLRWSVIFTGIFIASIFIGMQWGILGVAVSVLISHTLAMPIFTVWATKLVFAKNSTEFTEIKPKIKSSKH